MGPRDPFSYPFETRDARIAQFFTQESSTSSSAHVGHYSRFRVRNDVRDCFGTPLEDPVPQNPFFFARRAEHLEAWGRFCSHHPNASVICYHKYQYRFLRWKSKHAEVPSHIPMPSPSALFCNGGYFCKGKSQYCYFQHPLPLLRLGACFSLKVTFFDSGVEGQASCSVTAGKKKG